MKTILPLLLLLFWSSTSAQLPLLIGVDASMQESTGPRVQLGYQFTEKFAVVLRGDQRRLRTETYKRDFDLAEGGIYGLSIGGQFVLPTIKLYKQHRKNWTVGAGAYFRRFQDLRLVTTDFESYEETGGIFGLFTTTVGVNPYFRELRLNTSVSGFYFELGERYWFGRCVSLDWNLDFRSPLTAAQLPDAYWEYKVPWSMMRLHLSFHIGLKYFFRPRTVLPKMPPLKQSRRMQGY